MRLTAVVKSAEEITRIKGCTEFRGLGWAYTEEMQQYRAGKRINVIKIKEHALFKDSEQVDNYDYVDALKVRILYKEEWLKDFIEEIDWSDVPIDTKVIADGKRGYFAGVIDGKPIIWLHGTTSWGCYNNRNNIFYPVSIKLYED